MRVNEFGQQVGDPVDWSAPAAIVGTELVGRYCTVVPYRPEQIEALVAACVTGSPPSTWTYLPVGPFAEPSGLQPWLDGLAADPTSVPHTICTPAGRPVGVASYLRLDVANGVVEVGAIVLSAELQRSTAATEAMYLMARHAFELGYRRYEWKCDAANEPSRRAAARLGFSYEGIFRNAVVYKGRNRDTAWFSITAAEWPGIRARLEEWLAPENFDGAGVQRSALTRPPGAETAVPDDGMTGIVS